MQSTNETGNATERGVFVRYRIITFTLIMLILLLLAVELISALLLSLYPNYQTVRQILLGDTRQHIIHTQNTVGQAYLLYTPAPNFEENGTLQHNAAGYRGELIPLQRQPRTLRVLFMGGSTTYGWRVDQPGNTYPAQVGLMLERQYRNHFDKIEIINAGLIGGSSAEILTHYHFKFQYYRPDIVVINTGDNDAEASQLKQLYHPDYSHYRHQLPAAQPLPPSTRWLLHSRLISFLSIHLFFESLTQQSSVDTSSAPTTSWYTRPHESSIPEEDLAFKNNLATIIREIKANGSDILVLPFQMKPGNKIYSDNFKTELANNQRILQTLAEQENLAYAPFPPEIITERNWLDASHLNEAGHYEKAQHVFEYIIPLVNKKFPQSEYDSRSRKEEDRVIEDDYRSREDAARTKEAEDRAREDAARAREEFTRDTLEPPVPPQPEEKPRPPEREE